MRCCEQCIGLLKAEGSEEVNDDIDAVAAAIESRTSSKTLKKTFVTLFRAGDSPCRFCWGLFQAGSERLLDSNNSTGEHLWLLVRQNLQDVVPEIFHSSERVNIGIGLTPGKLTMTRNI